MNVGRSSSAEWDDYQNPLTGRRVRQLTDSPDGRQGIFTSHRTGSSNVYFTDWN
ncbi:MAG TPA: hypothetical protein VMN99_04620 [Anaerolineales bacterium]|nr:hypothetical protein [Anaerolineales bacterium]